MAGGAFIHSFFRSFIHSYPILCCSDVNEAWWSAIVVGTDDNHFSVILHFVLAHSFLSLWKWGEEKQDRDIIGRWKRERATERGVDQVAGNLLSFTLGSTRSTWWICIVPRWIISNGCKTQNWMRYRTSSSLPTGNLSQRITKNQQKMMYD